MPNDDVDNPQLHVAYLGPEASFSHQAALAVFRSANLHPLPSFNDIFSALQSSSTETPPDYAIVPIENSTNGSVNPVLDLLTRCASDHPDLQVCAEHYLPIHHFLFTSNTIHAPVDNRTVTEPPTQHLSKIKTLYTHPQVWGQCARFLSAHLPATVERLDTSSTSQAARIVAEDPSGTSAAICSSLAGSLSALDCLVEHIEDEPDKNTTRFFIFRNRTRDTPTPSLMSGEKINVKSLLLFTISHTTPGSLSSALRVFAEHDFNLTRIDTRPSRQQPWHYVFFVECEEERELGEEHEAKLRALVKGLEDATESLAVLGSWRDMLR